MGRGKLASPPIFRPPYRYFFCDQLYWLRLKRGLEPMRKPLRTVTFWMSLLVAVSAATHALCEQTYVSIQQLRETMPDRWVGEYVVEHGAPNQLEKGDTVSVDVPIVVPEVDAVPVVRIT